MEPGALPLKSVVLFIACGTMVFIIVFIFAKRQITRFALKSNRVPHAAIGTDAPKKMRLEIERRLKRVAEIKYEPRLISASLQQTDEITATEDPCHFVYRMKAVDAVSRLDEELRKYNPNIKRKPGVPMRTFLMEQREHNWSPLQGIHLDSVEKFADTYDHARHDPAEFGPDQYEEYMESLDVLLRHIYERDVPDEIALSSVLDDPTTLQAGNATAPSAIRPMNFSPQDGAIIHTTPEKESPKLLQPCRVSDPMSVEVASIATSAMVHVSVQPAQSADDDFTDNFDIASAASARLVPDVASTETCTLLDRNQETVVPNMTNSSSSNVHSSSSTSSSQEELHVAYRPRRSKIARDPVHRQGYIQVDPSNTCSSQESEMNLLSESQEHLTLDISETEKCGQNVESYV